MRIGWAAMVFPLAAFSQGPQAGALMRGVLLEHDASEFSIRAADSRVLRYQFDRKTYVERDHEMVDMARLAPGEQVEVISEKIEGSPLRYALTVHAIPAALPARPASPGRAPSAVEDRPLPYGSFSLTGVVFRIVPGAMSLHTRTGDQNVILRPDTRYMADGNNVEAVRPQDQHARVRPGGQDLVRRNRSVPGGVGRHPPAVGSGRGGTDDRFPSSVGEGLRPAKFHEIPGAMWGRLAGRQPAGRLAIGPRGD